MKITTGKDLGKIIDQIIENAIAEAPARGIKASLYHKSLEEKEKQDSIFGDDEGENDEKEDDSDGSDNLDLDLDSGEDDSEDTNSSSSGGDDKEKLESGDVEVDDIVEKLNTIRSGKSFKDSAIKEKLESYINDLDKAEKTALFAFLKGVAQITTGEVDSDEAEVPDKPAPDVHMQKGKEKQSKHVEPNIIKGAPKKKIVDKSHNQEDDSGPTPITPKK